MRSIIVILAALAVASPAVAMDPASAQLAAPARVAAVVTDAGLWRCDGSTCTGTVRTAARAVAICTSIAGEAGRVASFTAAGTALGDEDLARCNRHVKP